MKDFLKNVLATIVGLIVFMLIFVFIAGVGIGGMLASSETSATIEKNSVLVLKLKGSIVEQTTNNSIPFLSDVDMESIGMDNILTAIKKAKTNDNIKGIYIENDGVEADMSQFQEIRDALADFKQSKKWVIAYGESFGPGSYYLSSVADKIYMNPQGDIEWKGLTEVKIYVKDLLAKAGIKFIPLKVGKYKSAIDFFTGDGMSEPDRQQTTAYTQGTWNTIVNAVSQSRKISPAQLNAYADNLSMLQGGQFFLKAKMVDGLLYADQIKAEVQKRLGLDADDDINQVSIADMCSVPDTEKGNDEIAIYYASGDIVNAQNPRSMFSNDIQIAAETVCKDLEALADDDDVKAVVLRINSGGGDAFASEKIWRSMQLLRQKKPVVVSMSGLAASGAYYLSCGANWIVAEPLTLTGSIGIFGQIPDPSGLLTNKLNIKYDVVNTNKHSDFGQPFRPVSADEYAQLQAYIQQGYNLFVKRVADGRKMTTEHVNELAQGHVYLGKDALPLKLVDELGGLDKALAKAAALAKVKSYYTTSYPSETDFFTQLMEENTGGTFLDRAMQETLGDFYQPFVMLSTSRNMGKVQARLPYFTVYK